MEVNESQREAIDFCDGSCMVLAGPGSGKTTVITCRVRTLIEKYGVNPENILVITFTKAAASEMKERFHRLMNLETERKPLPVTFGTFHAVYFKILRYAYNYSANNIIREEEKYKIIRDIAEEMGLETDDEEEFIRGIIGEISTVKGEMLSLKHYYSKSCGEDNFKKIYKRYNDRLIRKNVIDFDDMLLMCHELLSQREDILRLWQNKYRYILIDEFQDINRVQYEVIKLLAKPENNLFIVGDDDQSIYAFRGAKPELMLNFPKEYGNAKKIVLDVNYRSERAIVAAAGRLIEHNEKRFKKKIKAAKKEEGQAEVFQAENHLQECMSILHIIDEHIKAGGRYGDIAVLYRTNTIPGILAGKLMEYNIPFKIKDAMPNIYEHFIAKNIIAYIKIAMGSRDRSDYLQIINKPKRYISRQVFAKPQVSIRELKAAYADKSYVTDRLDKLEYDLKMLKKMTPYAAVSYIRHAIGYEEYLHAYAEYRRIKPEELTDILEELTEGAKEYKSFEEWFSHMEEYGRELQRQTKEKGQKKDGVELSTMHGAKGLEYDTVIIMDANEGITPHKKAVLEADIEEERRMFYVAVTRAKRRLFVFFCKERYGKKAEASGFVEELELKIR